MVTRSGLDERAADRNQLDKIVNLANLMLAKFVRIGRVCVPGQEVEKRLHWFVKPLVIATGNTAYPYQTCGSATLVKLKGRHFLFFCGHQIRQIDPDRVMFPTRLGDSQTIVGGGTFRFVERNIGIADEEFVDLRCFEIDFAKVTIPNLASEFFDCYEADFWPHHSLKHLLLFGYPSEHVRFDLDASEQELAHLGFSCVVTGARYERPSHARWTHVLKMQRKDKFAPDGMSGGAVFHLGEDADGFFIGLAGILLRGGHSSEFVHFVDARAVSQFVNST